MTVLNWCTTSSVTRPCKSLLPSNYCRYQNLKPAKDAKTLLTVDYILEPSQEEIVEQLIPKNIKIQVYKAVFDSYASEHGARMTAMDKATENAGDLLKALKLAYNQARQAAITTELRKL
jgi:F-type H+-transporting ATPase subunit gamma